MKGGAHFSLWNGSWLGLWDKHHLSTKMEQTQAALGPYNTIARSSPFRLISSTGNKQPGVAWYSI